LKPDPEEFTPFRIAVPTSFESERLLLRCYTLSDAPTLSTAFNNNQRRLKQDFPGRVKKAWTKEDAETFIWQKKSGVGTARRFSYRHMGKEMPGVCRGNMLQRYYMEDPQGGCRILRAE
jgi:RimJ/RimL family protein N-acetyltransferase